MNFSKALFAISITGVLFTGCKQSESAPVDAKSDTNANAKTVAAKTETTSFKIDGMTCEFGCAKTIEKKLTGMDGIEEAKVDFAKKTATVKYDAAKQTPEKIVETVEAVADGKTYKVSDVKSSADHAMLYNNDKEKGKKKNKKNRGAKKECGPEGAKAEGKPSCCAAKKSCHA